MKSPATTAFLGNKLHCKSARELQKPRDADTLVQLQVSYYNVSEHICLQDKKKNKNSGTLCSAWLATERQWWKTAPSLLHFHLPEYVL